MRKPPKGTAPPRKRLMPVEERLASIHVELQREDLLLTSLQASLRGRWRGNCHHRDLGAPPRRLEFAPYRQWRGGSASTQDGADKDRWNAK
jgi:hypothetical protein